MRKISKVREEIFNRYSQNWQLVRPRFTDIDSKIPITFHDAIFCPLCLKLLNRTSLSSTDESSVTLEHLPPESLGGKGKILLCKNCNNTTGYLLDVNLLKITSSNLLNQIALSSVSFDNFKASGTLHFQSDKTLFFKLDIKDDHRRSLFKNIVQKKRDFNFNFTRPSDKILHVALIKVAYLIAFHRFGHSYILSGHFNKIRQQILEPDKDILPLCAALNPEGINLKEGVYAVLEPDQLSGLLVSFALKVKGKIQPHYVLLPPPQKDAFDFYTEIEPIIKSKFAIKRIERFLDQDFVMNKDYLFAAYNPFRKNN